LLQQAARGRQLGRRGLETRSWFADSAAGGVGVVLVFIDFIG
jgi:hypothetical protein